MIEKTLLANRIWKNGFFSLFERCGFWGQTFKDTAAFATTAERELSAAFEVEPTVWRSRSDDAVSTISAARRSRARVLRMPVRAGARVLRRRRVFARFVADGMC